MIQNQSAQRSHAGKANELTFLPYKKALREATDMKALKDAACGSVPRTKRGNLLLETLVKVEDMYMVGHIDETSRT